MKAEFIERGNMLLPFPLCHLSNMRAMLCGGKLSHFIFDQAPAFAQVINEGKRTPNQGLKYICVFAYVYKYTHNVARS